MTALWQAVKVLAGGAERRVQHDLHDDACATHPHLGIGNINSESSVTSYEVSWSTPGNSAMLRLMPCCIWLLLATHALFLSPSAFASKTDYLLRTTRQAATMLLEHLRGDRTRRSCGWSGPRVREEAPECVGALPRRYGRVSRVWSDVRGVARVVTVASESMLVTQGRLYRSVHAVDSVRTGFCVMVSN